MVRRGTMLLFLLLLPMLVGATTREPVPFATHRASPPPALRGQEWIQYDFDNWPYTWTSVGGYMCNMFFPRHPAWYPFNVVQVQYQFGRIDNQNTPGASGIIDRIRVFNDALYPVAEWVNVPGNVAVWQTVSTSPGPMIYGGPFYVGAWNQSENDRPLQGTVDAALWPGTYWPASNIEPFIWITGPSTSGATSGWQASTAPGSNFTTTSVASFRVLVSGETVPVELYSLQGKARPGYVVISWTTASERDNFGFNVYRSESEHGSYVKVNERIIPGHGTTSVSHTYTYADYGVRPQTTYFYKVEDVSTDGSSTFHGPIAVPLGAEFVSSWGSIKAAFK